MPGSQCSSPASRQIKALRTRYGSAGNKDDRRGAYVLADTLRTDGHRWQPLREDHPETKALQTMCRARKDLVEIRVQVMNQLRSNLELAFPGTLGLFSRLDSPITLAFLRRFPTAAQASWLSPARLERWLRSVGYSGGIAAQTLYRHLDGAAPDSSSVEAQARGQITTGLVTIIETLTAEIIRIETQIRKLFDAHPDQKIFTSLPRPGNGQSGNPSGGDRGLPRAVRGVIGAGIVGANVAFRLAQSGHSVTVVDAGQVGKRTSGNSFSWLNSLNKSPLAYHRLNMMGISEYATLGQEIGA
ncbi:FAD-dependent oxidoreductase [Rhodococcus globerulus]|uniref:FAD-dependent oxidoreductase n=1 Tax=Rhodococcus globerulus TaxID=33008 RepID=A0ABU4C3T0_RHOGO|nr:FAD-dependent oxidoreductase [Rhodococcus globerulus]MDV6271165.1 FAD-dependent oxidoreductase [Rhodococcus globerulus]